MDVDVEVKRIRSALSCVVIAIVVLAIGRTAISAIGTVTGLSRFQMEILFLLNKALVVAIPVRPMLRIPDRCARVVFISMSVILLILATANLFDVADQLVRSLSTVPTVLVTFLIYRLSVLYSRHDKLRQTKLLEALALGTTNTTGADFLKSLVTSVVDVLGVDSAVVSKVTESGSDETIVAASHRDGVPDEFQVGKSLDCGVRFSESESGTLIPLTRSSGQPIGHFGLAYEPGRRISSLQVLALRVFATRATAELERQESDDKAAALQAKITHSQKLESLSLMSAGIAHDVNNILAAIASASALIRDREMQEPETLAHVEVIECSVDRGAKLCRNLLAYSGRAIREDGECDFNAIVRESAHIVGVSTSLRVPIRVHVSNHAARVWGDSAQLCQVVLNLVTNAVDATESVQRPVEVRTWLGSADDRADLSLCDERDYVFIEVKDRGCGIACKNLESIFDPFFTTKGQGRGLGLAAVAGIVRDHEGDISVASEPDVGTTFVAAFPVTHRPAEPADIPEPPQVGNAQGQKVMLVDDDDLVRASTQLLLELAGYEVVAAACGQDAIETFENQGDVFDVLILDQTMPKLTGIETYRKLRELGSEARVIIMSGYGTHQLDDIADVSFLSKPFSQASLFDAIARSPAFAP